MWVCYFCSCNLLGLLMGNIGRYSDHCSHGFGVRYFGDYQFWVLRFAQPPGQGFYDRYMMLFADDVRLMNCAKGLVDLRDISFLGHDDALCDIVDLSLGQLERGKKYAVLCSTPLESAFFYLLQQKATQNNYSLGLFSSMDAALHYLNVPVDPFYLDGQLKGLAEFFPESDSSLTRRVAI